MKQTLNVNLSIPQYIRENRIQLGSAVSEISAHRRTDKQTNRQTDKQTNRQTDKQTKKKLITFLGSTST